MKLSIVTTLYQSSNTIDLFHKKISYVAKKIYKNNYEIIYVNDGSTDNTLIKAKKIISKDSKSILIDLSKNFGHHKAIMTGLEFSKGDHIFLIDSDLEEDPDLLYSFYKNLIESNCDVVYGVQERRKGGFFERISGQIFWILFNFFSIIKVPNNISTIRLMKKKYVESLLQFKEAEPLIAGLWYLVGFNQKGITINKLSKGTSTYTLKKKINYLLTSITSFSNKPLYYVFYFGVLTFSLSLIFCIYFLFIYFTGYIKLEGWTSIILSIWLIGGLIVTILGIISLYLAQIYIESKKRPNTFINQIYKKIK